MAKRKYKPHDLFLDEGLLEGGSALCFSSMLTSQHAPFQEFPWVQVPSPQALRCPGCLYFFEEVMLKKYLGCSHCYTVFEGYLKDYLSRLHKSCQHLGKVPSHCVSASVLETKVHELRAELDRMVAAERFQDAALVKHAIKTFTARLETLLNTSKKTGP